MTHPRPVKNQVPKEVVAALRGFNRFYTKKIGVLGEGLLDSPYSLVECRILFELGSRPAAGAVYASDLQEELGLDTGYLSRILARFERLRLIARSQDEADGRRRSIALTPEGRGALRDLDRRSSAEMARILSGLSELQRAELVGSMRRIEATLGCDADKPPELKLGEPGPGDLGWVVSAHGEIYSAEYGWGPEFEALVAGIVADFAARHDPRKEKAWIARLDGRRVGSIFLVKAGATAAKLRLLILAPEARGRGIGKRLVGECLGFARSAGYRNVELWTNSSLAAARGIYAKAGFRLVATEPETHFGRGTVSETWELAL